MERAWVDLMSCIDVYGELIFLLSRMVIMAAIYNLYRAFIRGSRQLASSGQNQSAPGPGLHSVLKSGKLDLREGDRYSVQPWSEAAILYVDPHGHTRCH